MIVVFEKGFALRHIGHLDLMRTIQRALRRTTLPIRYSNGFNPHIQLSFAAPLSVGVVGMREVMDVPMAEDVAPEAFTEQLNQVLPGCLRVRGVRAVSDDYPTLMALVAGSAIRVQWDASDDGERIAAALPQFLGQESCVTLRKTKSGENMTNIRPFVAQAECVTTPNGYTLKVLIENRKEGSLKPAVFMNALCELAGVEKVPYIAYRDAILARKRDGRLLPLEEYNHG